MMAISFGCETCGRRLKAADEHAGKRTRCPGCAMIMTVPTPAPPPPPAPTYASEEGEDVYRIDEPARPAPDPASTFLSWTDPNPKPKSPAMAFSPVPAGLRPEQKKTKDGLIRLESAEPARGFREYLYCLLVFALVPLLISLANTEEEKIADRIQKTLQAATPEQRAKILPLLSNEHVEKQTLLAALPEGRLAGAHLPYDSSAHWIYALISAVAFIALMALMFETDRVDPLRLAGAGLFTGTVGIALLLAFQWCSEIQFDRIPRGWIGLIFLFLRFIGWSYECALDPSSGFWLSAMGFTFGVGMCEEFCKAIPLIALLLWGSERGWRGMCVLGLASGVGFGVSEGITYSYDMYNGIAEANVYLLRFVSCVALHAMWAGSVGMSAYVRRDELADAEGWGWAWVALKMVAVPMALHGFYDTLLKKDLNWGALAVSLASFAWFAFMIESCRARESSRR